MTVSVRVKLDAEVVYETWALNEASVEKVVSPFTRALCEQHATVARRPEQETIFFNVVRPVLGTHWIV